jgi:asparagine synthase (glutamine-hydrolysing)
MRALAAKTVKAIGGSSVSSDKSAAMVASDGSLASVFPLMRQVLSSKQRRALMSDQWLGIVSDSPDPYVRLLEKAFGAASRAELLARISYAEGRTYMHDVLLRDTDQMSMAHALEVRVPLLDHKLVQYLIGLPDAHKRSNGTPKRLLVESLKGLLPEEIVARPKQGFTLPFDVWMRGALKGYCEERLSPERTEARGLLRPAEVQKLWKDFLSGNNSVSWSRLWVLVVLEEWMEQNSIACGN